MTVKLKKEAIAKFRERFMKSPYDLGFPVIDVYEKQSAFLYGQSKEAVEGYKTCQNIIRWIMVYYLLPMVICVIVFMFGLLQYCNNNVVNPLIIISLTFFVFWIILFIVLYIKAKKADKISKGKVIWINY